MEGIYEPTDTFQFEKLELLTPTQHAGGNYFIKLKIQNNPLYIQPPKCKTKSGIAKAGKKHYTDLMFTNENEKFIRWLENLENYCQKHIFENRAKWFETDLDDHDIEDYFVSPLKVYKSGKYYIVRANIPNVLGKSTLKIYDEDENEIDYENVKENMDIMTIVEIQGIKCSARSFQIEIEVKQMLLLKPSNIFEKCILKVNTNRAANVAPANQAIAPLPEDIDALVTFDTFPKILISEPQQNAVDIIEPDINEQPDFDESGESQNIIEEPRDDLGEHDDLVKRDDLGKHDDLVKHDDLGGNKDPNEICEVQLNLEEMDSTDSIQLKERNDVYYKMYREAKRKARLARDLALSSYLEAKRIKNTYMLEDMNDSESDLDDEDFDVESDKNEKE